MAQMMKGSAERFSRNSLALLTGRFAGQILAFFFTLIIARHLGATGLGAYAFLSAIVFVGNVATTFGLDTQLIRTTAQEPLAARIMAKQAVQLELILLTAFLLLIVLVQPLLLSRTEAPALALWLYLLSLIPLAFGTVCSAFLRGHERMDLYLLYTVCGQAIMLLGAMLLWFVPAGLAYLTGVILLAQVVAAIMAYLLCQQIDPEFQLPVWQKIESAALVRLARSTWPLALLATFALLYQRLGIFSLNWFTDDTVVGHFSAAGRLVDASKAVPYAIFGALFPIMSQQAETASWAGRYRNLFWVLFGLVLLGTILLSFIGPWLVLQLFGEGYGPAGTTLQILTWSLPPFLITLRLSFDLVTAGQDRTALLAMLITLLISGPIFLFAGSRYGLAGVAWTTVIAELIQAAVLGALAWQTLDKGNS